MRRAGLVAALTYAAFAAAEDAAPAVTSLVNGQTADVKSALQNILIQTEDAKPASIILGDAETPMGISISNQPGEEAIVLVAPDLMVAPKVGQVGCYTIGDDVSKIALLMCEDKDSAATPVPDKEKDGQAFAWVKGTLTNEGPEAICQLKFASNDLKLGMAAIETVPKELGNLTPFKLEPQESINYSFLLPIDAKEMAAPLVGIQDTLGPCKMIEKAKEALAAGNLVGDNTLADSGKAASDALAKGSEVAKKAADNANAAAEEALKAAKNSQVATDADGPDSGDDDDGDESTGSSTEMTAKDQLAQSADDSADDDGTSGDDGSPTELTAKSAIKGIKDALTGAADATVKAAQEATAATQAAAGGAVDSAQGAAGAVTDAAQGAVDSATGGAQAAADSASGDVLADDDNTEAATAGDPADEAKSAVEKAAGKVKDAAANVPKASNALDVNGDGADDEATSPAPKVGASLVGLFTVAVVVAAQFLL